MIRIIDIVNLFRSKYFIPVIYLMIGSSVFIVTLLTIYTYIFHLKVNTAVISATLQSMAAPASGYIASIYVLPGKIIKKGTPLIKIENLEIERDLELAKIGLEETKINLNYFQRLLDNEESKLDIYQKIGNNRVISAQSAVNIAKQEALVAKNNLERMRSLHKQHYISEVTWEEHLAKFNKANENLKNVLAQKNLENNSLKATKNGLYFTGNKIEGSTNDLLAQYNVIKQKLILDQNKVNVFLAIKSKLTIHAPFNCKVIEVLKSVGGTADNLKPIILLENYDSSKTITAYLTQNEITHINISKQVKIYIPSINKIFMGHIAEIDRTSAFIDVMKSQYQWHDLDIDRSAKVVINIDKNHEKSFNQVANAGMPAIVYFSKKNHFF